MKSVAQLVPSIEQVQPSEIGRAHKILHRDGNYYKVQSSRDAVVEYTVKYSREHGFTCTCPSGQRGFSNCKIGVCSHCVIALAAASEEREALLELAAATCATGAPVATYTTDQDAATVARVMVACEAPRKASKAAPYQAKAFSLLK